MLTFEEAETIREYLGMHWEWDDAKELMNKIDGYLNHVEALENVDTTVTEAYD